MNLWYSRFKKATSKRTPHSGTCTPHSGTRASHSGMRTPSALTLRLYQLFCTWCWGIREVCNQDFDFDQRLLLAELTAIVSGSALICIATHEQPISIKRLVVSRRTQSMFQSLCFEVFGFWPTNNMNYWNYWVSPTKRFVLYGEIDLWPERKNGVQTTSGGSSGDIFGEGGCAYRNGRCAYRNGGCTFRNGGCAYW